MFTINKKGCKTHYDRSKGQQAFTDIMPMWLKKKKKSRGKTVLSKKEKANKKNDRDKLLCFHKQFIHSLFYSELKSLPLPPSDQVR